MLDKMEREMDCIFWREQNLVFHNLLYDAANRPKTLDQIALLRQQVDRYIRIHMSLIREESQKQHRQILEAVKAHDVAGALASLTSHLEYTSRTLRACVRRTKSKNHGREKS